MGRHSRRKRTSGKGSRNLGATRPGKGRQRKHLSAVKIRHRCRLVKDKGQQRSGSATGRTKKNRLIHIASQVKKRDFKSPGDNRNCDICRLYPYVASNVAHKWRDLARQLGLTEPNISAIDANQRGDAKESCIEAIETWRLRSGRSATVPELKKALVEAGLKLVADEMDEFPAADDTAVSMRTTPMMFQTMPCQGTFGNRKRDKVCHEMVTQLEKLAWQGHWQKLGRFASRASRRYKDQPDVVIRVMFEKVLACNFRYDLEGGYACLKQAEKLLFKTDDAHHHQARMLEVKAVLLKKQKKYQEAKTAIDLAQQALVSMKKGRDQGKIWYTFASLHALMFINSEVTSHQLLVSGTCQSPYHSAMRGFQQALDNFQAEEDDSLYRDKRCGIVHVRQAQLLLQCWSEARRFDKDVYISEENLKEAENNLHEVENKYWENIPNRTKCYWHLAKSDLHRYRCNKQRARELAKEALKIAKSFGFSSEMSFIIL
uniref:Death domain-containing protein n=1 Tax=Branchiostoma floridae TaxID=7739 RepID=C3Z8M4_BRAFL|eukprot:XP_002595118.1 hypothetical protein BRAFLDRAFT_67900 [Branchiostoma floridae]